MALAELKASWDGAYSKGTPQRFKDLDALDRVLNGTIYDKLPYPFHVEEAEGRGPAGSPQAYVPLVERRPSIRFNLAKIVTDEYTSLTWSEGHGPYVQVYNPWQADGEDRDPQEQKLEQIIQFLRHRVRMDAVMFDAQWKGSTGSSACIIKVKPDGTPWIRVVEGKYLNPVFKKDDPDTLEYLDEVYDTTAEKLIKEGYTYAELARENEDPSEIKPSRVYWMNIRLGEKAERWMKPLTEEEFARLGAPIPEADQKGCTDTCANCADGCNCGEDCPCGQVYDWELDPKRQYDHKWGEVPAVYGRNLHEREKIDGPCSFNDIIDIAIDLDYLLSQSSRGYKYSMDPLIAFEKGELNNKMPISAGIPKDQGSGPIIRTPSRAVNAPQGGTVKMLEITGQGLNSAREFVKMLREWALEVAGGMKSDQEHAGGPQSGRALELLHQALVWLVSRMRGDWGDGVMVPLLRIMLRGLKKGVIKLWGLDAESVPDDQYPLKLVWPSWWQPRGADLFETAQALLIAAGGSPQDPKQLLPLKQIFQVFAAALGLPDPIRVAEQASKEFQEHQKRQEDLLVKEKTLAPPRPAGGSSQ